MKLTIACPFCSPSSSGDTLAVGEILDGGIVHARCEDGHAVTYALNEPAFELMFEFAALALLDGYYREAVLGFTTSLERFYAFAAKMIAARHGTPSEVFGQAWKKINRAERQLGAFLALYALEMKRPCDLKAVEKFTNLRNEVAHEGVIPTREDALAYGEAALEFLHRMLRELVGDNFHAAAKRMGEASAIAVEERGQVAPPSGSMLIHLARFQTMVGLKTPTEWRPGVFAERLEMLRETRDNWYAPRDESEPKEDDDAS